MSTLFEDFDPRLVVAWTPIVDAPNTLRAAESDVVARVSAVRRREFATGRALARELLGRLGAVDPVVPSAPDRSPSWPEGFVGSIAHTDRVCVVAVGRASDFGSVGIDVEPARPLESDLFATIATARELERVARLSPDIRGLAVRRLFTAKEAVYKCLYPLVGVFLDFHDVQVEFDADGRSFGAEVRHPAAHEFPVEGRVVLEHGSIHALVVCRAFVQAS